MDQSMNRRTFVKGSAAAAAALYLSACGTGQSTVSGTVRIPGGTFGFPTPFAYIAGLGYVQMNFIYDTLMWKDDSGNTYPWLASSASRSADGLTYTFQIRPGVKWQDGQPLTAEDVAFTYNYFLTQPLGPLIIAQPYFVTSARATGPLTAEIKLAIPAVTFLDSVAGSLPIVPKHIWQGIKNAPQANQDLHFAMGSGPYKLTSFSLGEGSYQYEANDSYFLGKPFIRQVELVPVDDNLIALEANTIDIGETQPDGTTNDALAPFRSSQYGIISQAGDFMWPLVFNIGKGGALADVRFRQACAHAINRPAIASRIVGPNGSAGNPGFLPPSHPYYVPVEQYAYSPALANQLLDAAGYHQPSGGGTRVGPDGKPLSFALLVTNNPVPPVVNLLIPALRAIGVELTIKAVDAPTMFGLAQQDQDEMALTLYPGPQGACPNADPDTLRSYYSSKVKNRLSGAQGYVNPEFDRLATAQLIEADVPKRKQMIARMQQIIAHDLPALPLYYSTLFSAYRKSAFDQWYYTPGGMGSGLPSAINKQALLTGTKIGTTIRKA